MMVDVGPTGRQVRLDVAGARIEHHELGVLRAVQQVLADPNIAFLLLSIGTLGLIYELATPGLGVGGALGAVFILLAMFGLAVLPVAAVGVMFLVLAVALFVAEVAAPGVGLAAAGGALAMVLSGIFLVDDAPGISVSAVVVVPSAVVVAGFVVIAGRVALRSRRAPSSTTGQGLLVGRRVPVRRRGAGSHVFLQGAWWSIRPADQAAVVADGSLVEVVGMEGLTLVVEPLPTTSDVTVDPEAPEDAGEPS
jgi:membrane-bound serine protease (ClpP class)